MLDETSVWTWTVFNLNCHFKTRMHYSKWGLNVYFLQTGCCWTRRRIAMLAQHLDVYEMASYINPTLVCVHIYPIYVLYFNDNLTLSQKLS